MTPSRVSAQSLTAPACFLCSPSPASFISNSLTSTAPPPVSLRRPRHPRPITFPSCSAAPPSSPSSPSSISSSSSSPSPITTPSALDAIPTSLKLNAVAESLARSRDVPSALAVADELQSSGLSLEPRARAAIVDAIASSPGADGARSLARLFSRAPPGGYGASAPTPALLSAAAPDEELPDAGRRAEMALAAAFVTVVGASVGAEVVEPLVLHHAAPEATTVLMIIIGGLVYDQFAAAGVWWGRVAGGMDRLLSDDPAREASVEAAFFLVAYLLGLPWAPFQPDVGRVLEMHGVKRRAKGKGSKRRRRAGKKAGDAVGGDVENNGGEYASTGLDEGTVDRYLVWLLAGVAAEARLDGQLVESDAAWARELLRATTAQVDEGRILRAYSSAKDLLERHQVLHARLAEKMLAGLSAGECVILLEKSLKFA